jgi:hypothetical protein
LSSLEDVCTQLKRFGLNYDSEELRKAYPREEQLAQVERNLWKMLRNIEEERNRMGTS